VVASQRGAHRPGPGDETHALRRIVAKARPLLSTEHVLVARTDGDVLRVVAGSGVAVRLIGVEVPPGLGLFATSVGSPRVVTTADYARHPRAVPAVVEAKVRGLAVAPILVRGDFAGCVCALKLEPGRFSSGERSALEMLAAEAAAAIEPREHHRRHVERIEVISQALFGPYDVAAVLDRVRVLAERLAPAAEILVALRDGPDEREQTFRCGRRARRRGRLPDTAPTTFPIRFGDRMLGTLHAGSASAEETETLADLARLLGTAVANARLVQELRAGSERAARIVAEREAMVRDLVASEERLRTIYDAMACGVIVRDAGGAIVQTNAAAERILGLSAEQLREGGDLSFLEPTTEDGTELANGSYPWQVAIRTRRSVQDRAVRVTRPDGERRWLHLDVVPVVDERGEVVEIVSSFIDITDRKRAEEELEARARQQESVVELGQQATAGASFSDLMERAAALVARALGVEYVKILELLPDGGALTLRSGLGWRQGVVGNLVLAAELSQGGYALRSGAPVVVDDLATEARFPKPALLADHGVTSGLSVVIDTKEGPFGTLGAHTVRRRSFGASDVAFLQVIANMLGGVAQRERRRAQRSVLLGRLTPREREVLRLTAEGLNNRDIAARLGIGYATVRRHVRGFIEKLDTRSKLEAVARAQSYGLLSDDAGR